MNKISRKLYQDRRCRRHERCDRRCSGCLQFRFRFCLHFRCCRSVHPRHLRGTAEGISSTVKVTMTFSDSAVTDVVVDTSGETASFGAAAADELREQLLAAGSAEIDGVSGSTITSDAVMKAAKSCYAQAKGEAVVSSVQLPTGDENDWLGKEPDIDEAAITETVDTDILIVGAGNGGMFAAAYAAANG
mgnify:CR=1 FL=1